MNRRTFLACLTLPVAMPLSAAPVPDHTAIRDWLLVKHPARSWDPALRQAAFEQEIGRLPYQFRSAADGSTVRLVGFGEYGGPIMIRANGEPL